MRRRDFLKGGAALAATLELGGKNARATVPAHNWGSYDFGSGPAVADRLNQGPFAQYPPDATIPTDGVVMTTTPSEQAVANVGRGLITYVTADMGTDEIKSDDIPRAIEELAGFPLGQLLYVRPTWREIQPRPGRLDLPDYLKLVLDLAKADRKRLGIRIQLSAPDVLHQPALPDFVLEKVPTVELVPDPRDAKAAERFLRNPFARYQPRYDHPFFQACFRELVGLMAAEFNGNPLVEFIDTFMYGFWGEGHTWPFLNSPFPDVRTAERTWLDMLEVQLSSFTLTPLVTNTQPDYSRVGNSEVLDRTVRTNNWIRSDTILIENEQIEALSNRPPWIAAVLEQGLPGRPQSPVPAQEGISVSDNLIAQVMGVGANYWSLWNFHQISARNLMDAYRASPAGFDLINRRIGYSVRPTLVWSYEEGDNVGLVIGFANDGIAGVPGVLRVTLEREDGRILKSGCLDPGHPLPGKIRQAQFVLPPAEKWEGLRLRAQIEVKGRRLPVRWACHQKLNADGSLTLRPNLQRGNWS
jgi:hypothetical protein